MIHPFEEAGLGKYPFRFVELIEVWFVAAPGIPRRPGSTCDYCGTSIAEVCVVKDALGKKFKVGNECIKKVGDSALIDPAKREIAKLRLTLKHEKDKLKIDEIHQSLQHPDVQAKLLSIPSPIAWRAAQGGTALEWAQWMMKHAGVTGQLQVGKFIKQLFNE